MIEGRCRAGPPLIVVDDLRRLRLLCRTGIIDRVTMIPPSEMVVSLWDILRSGRFNSRHLLHALQHRGGDRARDRRSASSIGAVTACVAAPAAGDRAAAVGLLRDPDLRVLSAADRRVRRRAHRADRDGRDVRHRGDDRQHHARARPRAAGGRPRPARSCGSTRCASSFSSGCRRRRRIWSPASSSRSPIR